MKRVQLILFWILIATTFSFGQGTTLYYPQVTNGLLGSSIWKTTIFLGNPAGSTVSGTVTLFQEVPSDTQLAGVPFNSISFVNESGVLVSNGNTIPFQLGPGESRKFTSTGEGEYHGGFAMVSANGPVNGAAVFSAFYSDGSSSEGGLSSSTAVTKQAIFVDTTNGYNVGVALANPTTSQMTVTLSLLLNTGAAAAQPTTVTLGANNHKAAFVSELFQGIGPMVGSMQVTSATAVPAVALRFDPTFKVFTTLPPFTLASLISPAMDWLEQRPLFSPLTSIARLFAAFHLRLV